VKATLIELSATKLKLMNPCRPGTVVEIIRIYPDALPVKAGFEALHADDGKQQPKESDQKRNVD
jgi:hypothetical protein